MKMNIRSIAQFCCASIFLLTGACVSHDLGELDSPFVVTCTAEDENISYGGQIDPLIKANCIFDGCHGHDPGIPDWRNHAELESHIDEIQRRITLPLSDPDKMPRGRTITAEDRKTLYCWLENGAPNN
jgi:hypothetical protein